MWQRNIENWLSKRLSIPPTPHPLRGRYDAAYIVPFGTSKDSNSRPSSQSKEILDVLIQDIKAGYEIECIHVGGGYPHPGTKGSEAHAAARYLTNKVPATLIRIEDLSWDTGDNAWHFRKSVIAHRWTTVVIYVVKEQSKRAYHDFQEYLDREYVGWPVEVHVVPVPCAIWMDNIKPCLRSKLQFMLYEVIKIALRRCGFVFMYRHKPDDT